MKIVVFLTANRRLVCFLPGVDEPRHIFVTYPPKESLDAVGVKSTFRGAAAAQYSDAVKYRAVFVDVEYSSESREPVFDA